MLVMASGSSKALECEALYREMLLSRRCLRRELVYHRLQALLHADV